LGVGRSSSLWSTVKEAIRGSHQDYTEAPIGRAVVLLAVPMVLEMMMESVFVVADVFFVGRLGLDAVATVGITESLMTVMYALAIGLSIGAAATVVRRVGEKDPDSAARTAVQSVIILFALLPSFGVSNAAATLVGQNLGAGKPDRAEAAAWKAGMYNTVCLGTVGAIFLIFAPQLIQFFTSDPEVARQGVRCLRIVAAGFLFYGYAMVLTASFNGAGDTRTPTLINLFCLWMWEIPLAWALAHPLGFGPTGVFIAVSVAFSTMAFVSGWLFSKGLWKTKRV
jgi:Na+-driven multidrug efflux pump